MTIADLCVGDQVFFNSKETGIDVSPLGGDGGVWAADSGDEMTCRRDTPSATEIQKYQAHGERLQHQFFFAASVHDLSDVRDNPQAHRMHWVSTRNGVSVSRYLRVLACYMEDTPDDDPDMEMWVVDASEETTRNDSVEASA